MAQFEVKAERGNWNGSGDAAAVIAIMENNVRPEDAHLAPMALEIIAEQMGNLENGGRLAYNWACSVLDAIVVRTA